MRFRILLVTVVLASLAGAHAYAQRDRPVPNPLAVELTVSHETAPPGGVAQVKVHLTEPKPISTGLFQVSGDFGELAGVSIFSPLGDAYGVAIPSPGGLLVLATSSLAGLGTGDSDYPIVTLTVQVPLTAVMGTVFPISLDPSGLILTGPGGAQYVATVTDGSLTVGEIPAVEDVIPGSDLVPAGGTVTVLGRGFSLGSKLQIEGAEIAQVLLVSPQEFAVTLESDSVMHGKRFRLRLDGSNIETEYYSYQKTSNAFASQYAALQSVEPVPAFPGAAARTMLYPAVIPGEDKIQVLAVQNTHLAPVTLQITRMVAGLPESAPDVTLPAASRLVLGLDEVFGSPCAQRCTVKVTASSNVQAMGMVGDSALTTVLMIRAR